MKLTHAWKTLTGLNVTATCELTLKENMFADGHNVEVIACKKTFDITVEGMGSVGSYINRTSKEMGGVVFPASYGKLVISQENLDAIDGMVAEIERHPYWIAKEAKNAQGLKDSAEYDAHIARMTKEMGY